MAVPCAVEVVEHRIPTAEAGIAFTTGKAELVGSAAAAIAAVGCLLAADPKLTVQVEVYTDSRGAEEWNLRLSQDRADAVRAAVLALGADGARVTAVGYGESRPVDPANGTAAANRRVELHTEPPSERPPRPALPVASPAPPAPAPDGCSGWRDLGPAPPSWASCTAAGDGWRCVLPVGLAEATERVGACFGGVVDRDGTLLVLHVGSTRLVLTEDAGRAVLSR